MSIQSGADAARTLCLAIEAINQQAITDGNLAPDFKCMAEMMEVQINQTEAHREGFLLALSEFVSVALDGCVIIPELWKPLEPLTEE